MKKSLLISLAVLMIITLFACGTNEVKDVDDGYEDNTGCFIGKILEIHESYILVQPEEGSQELKSSDKISVSLKDVGKVEAEIGDKVEIRYSGEIAESYPAKINQTLSVVPVGFDFAIELFAENVTAKGLKLVCVQSGGDVKAELYTEARYVVQKETDGAWEDLQYIMDDEPGWDAVAYIVNINGETSWDVDWSQLYGELSAGHYRISKRFTVGNGLSTTVYAEFVIK